MKKPIVYASLATALLACAGALGYRAYIAERDAAFSALEAEVSSAASDVDQRMSRMLATFDAEVPLIEAFLRGRERTDDEITEYLRERTRRISTGVNASYIDLYIGYHGRYLCGNYWKPPSDFNIKVRPWYIFALKSAGRTAVVPPYAPADYPHQVMATSRCLDLDGGAITADPAGVLAMDVQLSQVEPIIGTSIAGVDSISFFTDSEGQVVASYGQSVINDIDLATVASAVDVGSDAYTEYGDYIVFHRHSKAGWTAMLICPHDAVLSAARWALAVPVVWAVLVFLVLLLSAEMFKYRNDIITGWHGSGTTLGRLVTPSVYFIVFIVVTIVVIYLLRVSDRGEYNTIVDRVERQLAKSVVPYEAYINTAMGAASYCSRHLEPMVLDDAEEPVISAETRRLVGIYRSLYGRNYRNIFIAGRNRYVDSIGFHPEADYDITGQSWYREAVAHPNSSVVIPPYVSVIDGLEHITITSVMTDPERTVAGIDISVNMLRSICGRLYVPGAKCSMLIAANGFVIDHHAFSSAEKHDDEDVDALVTRALSESGSFRMRIGDHERVVFSVPISLGGRFMVTADAAVIDGALSEHRVRMLALLIPLFASVLIIVFIALRRVRRTREREIAAREREKQSVALAKALDIAQSANRAKSMFLSSMSHDLRTPMNAIIGFAGVAKANAGDAERVKDCLGKIQMASEQLLTIIDNVLEMSRIEAGRMTLNEQVESLGEIVRGVDNLMRIQAATKNQEFNVTVIPADTMVICDRLRLTQVLMNLVSNAIKYTPAGGKVSLDIRLSPRDGRMRCEFVVSDTGIGMSAEFAERLFEPFAREQTSTISGIQGTGLGMAIAKRIVDMMGGEIRFVTKSGEGTVFTVSVDFRIPEENSK